MLIWFYANNLIRSSGETLTKDAFSRRLAAVTEYVYPSRKHYILCSEGMKNDEQLHQELALRERSNRVGLLAVISAYKI